MNKIITQHFLTGNWCAYRRDGSQHQGFGLTETEALADLALIDEERAESMEDASRGLSFERAGDMPPDEGGDL